MHKIGVFDSGMGGLSVATAIERALPDNEVLFVNDAKHLPYGSKTPEQLLGFVAPILKSMAEQGCDVIVIACNSVTTTILPKLRQRMQIPLIGMEPSVKPAAKLSRAGTIAVCATPLTLSSQRYAWLKQHYASYTTIVEPDCSDWVFMIENNIVDRQKITGQINAMCDAGADVIVLGCTHFHWIEQLIAEVAGSRATVLQPEQPVIEQLKRVLIKVAR